MADVIRYSPLLLKILVVLNLDGDTNTNLLKELPGIKQSRVTIRIIQGTDPRSPKSYITSFDLSYAEEYAGFNGKELTSYTPGVEVLFRSPYLF
jgi:hypothetical protein